MLSLRPSFVREDRQYGLCVTPHISNMVERKRVGLKVPNSSDSEVGKERARVALLRTSTSLVQSLNGSGMGGL